MNNKKHKCFTINFNQIRILKKRILQIHCALVNKYVFLNLHLTKSMS